MSLLATCTQAFFQLPSQLNTLRSIPKPQLQSYLPHDCSRRMQSATQKDMFCKRSLKHQNAEWTALNPKKYALQALTQTSARRVDSSQPKRVYSASANSNINTQSGQLSTQKGVFCKRPCRLNIRATKHEHGAKVRSNHTTSLLMA